MSARERFDDALRSANKYVDGKKALCPAHDDSNASLSISERRDGKGIVIMCHAGCDYRDVLAALGMSPRDLFDDDGIRGVYAAKRDYRYPDGRVVHRKPDKSFPQSGNTKGNSLFHADRVGDAQTVYWPEGEKDVEAIEAVGAVAVCSAMGAGKADRADVSPLRGKHVIVIADKDEPGRQHAQQISKILAGVATSARIVEAADGKDFADHFAAGKGLEELVPIAPAYGAELLDDIEEFLARFVVYPSEHERRAHVLWIAHTWLMDRWDSTPRIAFLSPEPSSGKSRALEVTEPLVPRPVHAVNTTPAYLFRKVSDRRRADDPLRRDRHRVRPEGQRQRRDPGNAQRRPPERRGGRPLCGPRQNRRNRGAARLLRGGPRRSWMTYPTHSCPGRSSAVCVGGHRRSLSSRGATG